MKRIAGAISVTFVYSFCVSIAYYIVFYYYNRITMSLDNGQQQFANGIYAGPFALVPAMFSLPVLFLLLKMQLPDKIRLVLICAATAFVPLFALTIATMAVGPASIDSVLTTMPYLSILIVVFVYFLVKSRI